MQTTPHIPHAAPVAVDVYSSSAGLRAVASLEALKGIAVLALLFILAAVHSHVEDLAENLLFHLHIDPDRHLSDTVMHAASKLGDMRLLTIALAAVSYSTVRFVESWGLWHRRVWAEWFALLSGALYIPLELLKIAQRPNWLHISVLAINLLIVGYMLEVRLRSLRRGGDVVV